MKRLMSIKLQRLHKIFLFSVILIGSSSQILAAELIQGRCHMDYCSWLSIESRDIVASSANGALIKAEIRSWSSYHPNGNYNKKAPRKGGNITVNYYFCSKSSPSVSFKDPQSDDWIVTTLAPGHIDDIYGYNITTYIEYFAVCHGIITDETTLANKTEYIGKKFEYTAKPNNDAAQKAIKNPLDLIKDQQTTNKN